MIAMVEATTARATSRRDGSWERLASIAAGRLGQPNEFGDMCAYLCSAQAGYVSGQNIQLDGGSYQGLI
jgi:3-oxoacyl-[acyl-carrier protein] reductase